MTTYEDYDRIIDIICDMTECEALTASEVVSTLEEEGLIEVVE
ncbi:hypothetical protein [Corynebacterium kalidii]